MNLSKLIVPMVAGLALSAAVASAQAQTTGNDGTTAPSQNRGTAAGSNLNSTTGSSSSGDSVGITGNSSMTNRVTPVSPAADEDAAADEQRVARADRN